MKKNKTQRAALVIFLLLSSLFAGQALARSWDVAARRSYSAHDVLGYGLGLRVGTQPVSGFYIGALAQVFPFSDEKVQVPCECVSPGYELVKTRKQIVMGGLEAGLEMRVGRFIIKPTMALGLAFLRIGSAFTNPTDGPALVTAQNYIRVMASPGIVVEASVSAVRLGFEIFYHNIAPMPLNSQQDPIRTVRALATGLSLGFSF